MKKRICALIVALGILVTSASALTVEQARDILREHYIDEIPEDILAHDTIDAILAALGDPYTEYYTQEELAGFYAAIEDTQLVGIGIRSYYYAQGVEVTQVVPDGPAAKAGIRAGDWIIAVDERDTRKASEEEVYTWIRGRLGTHVVLTVQRGDEVFRVQLTRQQVVFPTAMLEKIEGGIGWIVCSSFGSNTFAQFYRILTDYDSQVDGWVVDLRGNTGGNALTATLAAGCFGGWDAGLYMRDRSGQYYGYFSTPALIASLEPELDMSVFDEDGRLTQKSVCVLVDEGSASASELFCAAIRDSGSGVVVGTRTYGKGVAQSLFSKDYYLFGMEGFFDDGDGFKVTSERCFSVAGATHDLVGILPQFFVEDDLADEVAALLMAPYTEGDDALILRNVCRTNGVVRHFVMPLELLCVPENSTAVKQLLSSLVPGVICQIRQGEELTTVSVEQAAQICGVTLENEKFSDLGNSSYSGNIEVMRLYGIVDGYGDRTFRPTEALTRAEMCALFVKALRYPVFAEKTDAFSDVTEDAWYASYVDAMYRLGLINGYGNGEFHPEDPITHQEFLVLLGRIAQWLNMDYFEWMRPDGIYGELLPDAEALGQRYGAFHDWARNEIWLCDGEYAWTAVEEIDPAAVTTREEAAASMYRLFRNSGLLTN